MMPSRRFRAKTRKRKKSSQFVQRKKRNWLLSLMVLTVLLVLIWLVGSTLVVKVLSPEYWLKNTVQTDVFYYPSWQEVWVIRSSGETGQSAFYKLKLSQEKVDWIQSNQNRLLWNLQIFANSTAILNDTPPEIGKVKIWALAQAKQALVQLDFQTASNKMLIWSVLNSVTQQEVSVDQLSGWTTLLPAGASCPIGVTNTTQVNGVASSLSDLIRDQGGLVVKVVNQDISLEKSRIIADTQMLAECQMVTQLLSSVLAGNPSVVSSPGLMNEARVGVLVQIGQEDAQIIEQVEAINLD